MSFTALPDLASRLLGGGVVACNDEFFAAADNLVEPTPAVYSPKTFGAKGQVYDGWETRRRREPGHDWAVVRLGASGIVRGVVIDTAWFTGNYPPYASVDGCEIEGYPSPAELDSASWFPLLGRSPLSGDTANAFPVSSSNRVTHVRLNIFPDGGVARLRVHGEVVPDPRFVGLGGLVDLAATEHGGLVVGCSNMFYGNPSNLLLPGHARTMGEGWETARRRDDGNDWVIVRLGLPGVVRMAELDTTHFKGNAPGWARLSGVSSESRVSSVAGSSESVAESSSSGAGSSESFVEDEGAWFGILKRTRLQPDTRHRFLVPHSVGRATHVRLDVYPDGGMARLRLFGEPG